MKEKMQLIKSLMADIPELRTISAEELHNFILEAYHLIQSE
jgi:hypothetical protein